MDHHDEHFLHAQTLIEADGKYIAAVPLEAKQFVLALVLALVGHAHVKACAELNYFPFPIFYILCW